MLGPNERYRVALLKAEAITSIEAAALAALIDAEAAKIGRAPTRASGMRSRATRIRMPEVLRNL